MTSWRQLDLLKSRRQRGTRPPPAAEFATHCALADALRVGLAPGWLWTHFPAGELRDKSAAARLKRMGLKPGFPDFLLIGPNGTHHWLELKRGKAPLNEAQRGLRDEFEARGVPYAVARSYQEAIDRLIAWGAVRIKVAA